jgi:hypothetical protein
MSIYSHIKNTGFDLFITYHPKVISFKREAKTLHKEMKSSGLSLMQCQDLTAKQHGFQHWHHFISIIKKHYQATQLDYNGREIPTNNTNYFELSNPNFCLGQDENFAHYVWQDENEMRAHQLIIGENIYKNYDLFLAKQAIQKKQPVLFVNANLETVHGLIKHAQKYNRESDIRLINFSDAPIYPQFEYKINSSLNFGSGGLAEQIISLHPNLDWANEFVKFAYCSIFPGILMALSHKKHVQQEPVTMEKILHYLSLHNLVELSKEKFPGHITHTLHSYLNLLDPEKEHNNINFVITTNILKTHDELLLPIKTELKNLIDLNIFSPQSRSIKLDELFNHNYIYIFYCDNPNFTNGSLPQFLFKSIGNNIASGLGTSIESYDPKPHVKTMKYVFLHNITIPLNCTMVLSQSRALNVCLTFSYPNFNNIITNNEQFYPYLFAGCYTKIIVGEEKEAILYALKNNPTTNPNNDSNAEEASNNFLVVDNANFSIHLQPKNIQHPIWLIKKLDMCPINYRIEL